MALLSSSFQTASSYWDPTALSEPYPLPLGDPYDGSYYFSDTDMMSPDFENCGPRSLQVTQLSSTEPATISPRLINPPLPPLPPNQSLLGNKFDSCFVQMPSPPPHDIYSPTSSLSDERPPSAHSNVATRGSPTSPQLLSQNFLQGLDMAMQSTPQWLGVGSDGSHQLAVTKNATAPVQRQSYVPEFGSGSGSFSEEEGPVSAPESPPMRKSRKKAISSSRRHSQLSQPKKGNNKHGSKGTRTCFSCRKRKGSCIFEHLDEPCEHCSKANQECGPKLTKKEYDRSNTSSASRSKLRYSEIVAQMEKMHPHATAQEIETLSREHLAQMEAHHDV